MRPIIIDKLSKEDLDLVKDCIYKLQTKDKDKDKHIKALQNIYHKHVPKKGSFLNSGCKTCAYTIIAEFEAQLAYKPRHIEFLRAKHGQ